MEEIQNTAVEEKKRAKAAAEPVAVEEPKFRKVVIQRPYGVTDSHIFVGFNSFERQIQYDAPVSLPIAVINHLRSIKTAEPRPDEGGKMHISYSNTLSVVDVM